MRSRRWLILWVVGILFPMAFLGRLSPGFRRAFDTIFGPAWVHVVMHAALYAVLAFWLVLGFNRLPAKKAAWMILVAILIVGILQEGFQALNTGVISISGSALDLGVDLAGGGLGFGVILFIRRIQPNPNSIS